MIGIAGLTSTIPAATILTTIDVDVEDDWTTTVTLLNSIILKQIKD